MIKKLLFIFLLINSSFVIATGIDGIYSCNVSERHSGNLKELSSMVLLEIKENKATLEISGGSLGDRALLFTSKYSRNKNTIIFSEIYDEKGKKQQIDSISGKITKQGFGFSLGGVAGEITTVNNNTALFISNCIKKQYSDISTFDIKGIKFNSTFNSVMENFPCALKKFKFDDSVPNAYTCSDVNNWYIVGFNKDKRLTLIERTISSKAISKIKFKTMKEKIIKKYGNPTEKLTYSFIEGSFTTFFCWGSCKIIDGKIIMISPASLATGKGFVITYSESKDGNHLSFKFKDYLIQKTSDIEL